MCTGGSQKRIDGPHSMKYSYIPFLSSIHREMIFVATFLVVGDVIFVFIFLRCPHCKKLLNFKWSSQSICHNCGEKLDDDSLKS